MGRIDARLRKLEASSPTETDYSGWTEAELHAESLRIVRQLAALEGDDPLIVAARAMQELPWDMPDSSWSDEQFAVRRSLEKVIFGTQKYSYRVKVY